MTRAEIREARQIILGSISFQNAAGTDAVRRVFAHVDELDQAYQSLATRFTDLADSSLADSERRHGAPSVAVMGVALGMLTSDTSEVRMVRGHSSACACAECNVG